MAETYPYPEAEHYEFPRTPLAVLEDELHIYKDGPELRDSILGLETMYRGNPLHTNIVAYAALMKRAAIAAELISYSSDAAQDLAFLGGEVLAVHCSLRPMPRVMRQYMLGRDMLCVAYADAYNAEFRATVAQQTMRELIEYREQDWQTLLQAQDPAYREAILQASNTVYNDLPDTEILRDNFTAGYLYAGNLIFSSFGTGVAKYGDDY